MTTEMTCAQCRRALLDYLDGTLSPAIRVTVAAHLATCADCAADLAGWQALGDAVRAEHGTVAPAPAVTSRVWDQIAATIQTQGSPPMDTDSVAPPTALANGAQPDVAAPATSRRPARGRRGIFPVAVVVLVALVAIVTIIGARLRQDATTPGSPLVVVSVGTASQNVGQHFNIAGVEPHTGNMLWHTTYLISNAMMPPRRDIVSATRAWVHESNGVIYVYASDPNIGTPRISALRASDGHVLWHTSLPETPSNATLLADATGAYVLFTHQKTTEIVAYAAADGRQRWHVTQSFSAIGQVAVGAGMVVATLFPGLDQSGQAIGNGELFAIDAASGTVRWHATTLSYGEIYIFGDVVYTTAPPFTARRVSDGAVIWQQPGALQNSYMLVGGKFLALIRYPPCDACKQFIPSASVMVLNATTGAIVWQQTWHGTAQSTLLVGAFADAQFVYVGIQGTIETHALATGAVVWRNAYQAEYALPDGTGALYIRAAYNITAVQSDSGMLLWRYQLPGAEDIVAIADGLVVLGRNQIYVPVPTTLTALHSSNGAVAWQTQIQGSILFVIPT